MSNRSVKSRRPRPTDASGCFWCLVTLLAAMFYGQFSMLVGMLLLSMPPICLGWQIWKWRQDSQVKRAALKWCREFYPDGGGTSIVDVMMTLSHMANKLADDFSPSTSLDELNRALGFFDETVQEIENEHRPDVLKELVNELQYHSCSLALDLDTFRNLGDTKMAQVRSAIRQEWLETLLEDAQVRTVDLEDFHGDNLDSLMKFLIEQQS